MKMYKTSAKYKDKNLFENIYIHGTIITRETQKAHDF